MGGSAILLAETENYKWYIYENHSGSYQTYRLKVYNKKDENNDLEIREHSESSDKEYKEFDNAFDELEKERGLKYNYSKLTEEQITLAEMYKRMEEAERSLEYCKRRKQELEELFNKIKEAAKNGK